MNICGLLTAATTSKVRNALYKRDPYILIRVNKYMAGEFVLPKRKQLVNAKFTL